MPWKPDYPGQAPTLGYQVAEFIQAGCVIPDGDHQGEPYILTDEMLKFLLQFYRLDPATGKFVHSRGAQLVRPQKWGKGPFSAAIICAEAGGPVRFDGWDSQGKPVGKPWKTPVIQVTAMSEDQADNVWRALVPMIELGDLKADIPDTGETRINLPGGGRIEPVTSSALARLGQRVTFIVQDQTESWTKSNGGRKLADNQRRNIAGMGGRWLETPNAWDPTEESVAQQTNESKAPGVYIDDIEPPSNLSIRNKAERRKALKIVYGDSWWVLNHLDRIEAEILELLPRDPAQAERFFLNRKRAETGSAFDKTKWADTVQDRSIPSGSLIVLGIDGARYDDALGIVATEVETGHQVELGVWEQPENASDDYEHPLHEVDGVVTQAFEDYKVWRAYCDPQYIDSLLRSWQGRYGEKTVVAWYTNRPKPWAYACRNYAQAISAKELTHDASQAMARHIGNARKQKVAVYDEDRRQMWVISKEAPMSKRKIDLAAAGVLSWEARGDCIAAGVKSEPTSSVYEERGLATI